MIFESFDNLREAMDTVAARRRAAFDASTPAQRAISWGDGARCADGVIGVVWTLERLSDGADDPEDAEYVRVRRALHDEGLRYGRWYSQHFPEGEDGSRHVKDFTDRLTPQQVDAQVAAWRAEQAQQGPA